MSSTSSQSIQLAALLAMSAARLFSVYCTWNEMALVLTVGAPRTMMAGMFAGIALRRKLGLMERMDAPPKGSAMVYFPTSARVIVATPYWVLVLELLLNALLPLGRKAPQIRTDPGLLL